MCVDAENMLARSCTRHLEVLLFSIGFARCLLIRGRPDATVLAGVTAKAVRHFVLIIKTRRAAA